MTEMLERAIAAARSLPDREQDAEIEDERRWDYLFGRSPDVLEDLAREALAEVRARRTVCKRRP